ncbi:MAG TPA: PQQ-binding-like beta-propeller repeat protein [Candidatus Saccharimonadales bacterium]|nr:PQQ-binding-like beta-propeller repeat protein [Candidatus Saccharimonadales bacterium]
MKTALQWTLTSLLLACLAGSTYGQDWPQWRGKNRDGKAMDFTPPKSWPKELTQKWKVTVGDGVATPALVGDRLFVFSREEGNEVLRCLDAGSGKELWLDKYETQGAQGAAASFSGPRSSPTVAEGKVVTLGVRGALSCLDAKSGKKLWRKEDIRGWPNFFTSSSPLVANGLVIAQLGGRDNGMTAAFDLTSGEEKWKASDSTPAYASPVMMQVGGMNLVLVVTDGKIVALNAADGKQVWETPFKAQGMGGYNAATPIVDGQTIYYSGSRRGVKAVKLEKGAEGITAKESWNNAEKSVQFNSPVLKDGFIYGLTDKDELFCLNTQDGKTAWSAPISEAPAVGNPPPGPAAVAPGAEGERPPGGNRPPGGGGPGGGRRGGGGGGRAGYGSVVDAGKVMMALTPNSRLIVFEPNGKEFKRVASYKVAPSATHAYPIASGNRIFIKDKDSVILWTVD